MPSVSVCTYRHHMEGITRLPGSRLAEYRRAHPETAICQVEGTWHAWVPAGGYAGTETHGRTEDELLAKLTRPAAS